MEPETRTTLEACATMMGLQFSPTAKQGEGLYVVHPEADCQSHTVYWNPLASVADAAEMAIKLNIDVVWDFPRSESIYVQTYSRGSYFTAHVMCNRHKTKQAAYCYAICKVVEQLYRSGRDGT